MFDKYYNYGMAIPKIAPEHKVMLTVEEACGVFGIGEHTLRNLIRSNPRANYLLHVGTKTLIKIWSFVWVEICKRQRKKSC